jgi:hypothetical protein
VRSFSNWVTSRRRCVRIRTPWLRAASTKPEAAIVLPDAVGWRKRKRLLVLGCGGGVAAAVVRDDGLVGVRVGVVAVLVLVVSFVVVELCRILLVEADQLGEHARERVDLVTAQLDAGLQVRGLVAEHPLQPQHQREANLPLRARRLPARLHLGDGLVERAAARGAGCQCVLGRLALVEERLGCPSACAEGDGGQAVRRLRQWGRILGGVLQVSAARTVPPVRKAPAGSPTGDAVPKHIRTISRRPGTDSAAPVAPYG